MQNKVEVSCAMLAHRQHPLTNRLHTLTVVLAIIHALTKSYVRECEELFHAPTHNYDSFNTLTHTHTHKRTHARAPTERERVCVCVCVCVREREREREIGREYTHSHEYEHKCEF